MDQPYSQALGQPLITTNIITNELKIVNQIPCSCIHIKKSVVKFYDYKKTNKKQLEYFQQTKKEPPKRFL